MPDTETKKTTRKPRAKKAAAKPAEEAQEPQEQAQEAEEPRMALTRPPEDAHIALKLAWVVNDIGDRLPQATNDFHHYKYFSDKQISGMFQQRLTSQGIIMVPRVNGVDIQESKTAKGALTWITGMYVDLEFIDGHTGQTLVGTSYGQGDDPGDKGSNKAFTGAVKYFLLKLGLIGGKTDAEADNQTDERHSTPTRERPARTEVKGSDVKDVKRGGRQATANETQIAKIRSLAMDLGINAPGVGRVVENVLGIEVALPEKADEAGAPLLELLESLKAPDLGKIIATLEETRQRNESIDKDMDAAEEILVAGQAEDDESPPGY